MSITSSAPSTSTDQNYQSASVLQLILGGNAPSTSTNQSAQTLDENERESGSDIYEVNDE